MRNNLKKGACLLMLTGVIMSCGKQQIAKQVDPVQETGKKVQPLAYLQQCTKDQKIAVGLSYQLNNNIWGAGTNGAGSQCVWYNDGTLQWGCNASHTSGTAQNIKGYPALVRGWLWYNSTGSIWAPDPNNTFPVQLSHLQGCVSNWSMTVPTNGEKYNSSYDIWLDTQSNPNYKAQYEVMIWLNYKGPAYGGTDFTPIGTKVHSNVTIAGHTWDIWRGPNPTNQVYTFRRTTNTSSVSNLNIRSLLTYAQNDGFIQSSYYLLGIQAGWEIVSGGTFLTTNYTTTITKTP